MIMQPNPTQCYHLFPQPLASPSNPFSLASMDFGMKTRNRWSFGCEIEFQPHTCVEEDGAGICSPPLWNKKNVSQSIQNEISPLLPHDHCFSHPSQAASQLDKIVNARRELMEMVKNMSESTNELSLKDIVDELQTSQEVLEERSVEDRSKSLNSEIELLQQKSKKRTKHIKSRPITRSASMEKEVFLLKLFFPTSLGMQRKSAAEHGSKVSQNLKALGDNPEDNLGKEGWNRRFLCAGQRKNNGMNGIRSSSGKSSKRSLQLSIKKMPFNNS